MCTFLSRRYPYGSESRATHFTRTAHVARSRFPRPRPGKRDAKIPQQDHSRLIPRSANLPEREAAGTRDRTPSRAAAISLNQYLDQWLTTAAKPRLRQKSYTDYEALLRLHIRPVLGTRPLGAIVQFDIQSIYARLFERGSPAILRVHAGIFIAPVKRLELANASRASSPTKAATRERSRAGATFATTKGGSSWRSVTTWISAMRGR